MKNFESVLAPQINQFIANRQSLGYSIRPMRSPLLIFDRYVKDRKIKPGTILSPSFFLDFRNSLKWEPTSLNNLLTTVRVFFNFMVRMDYYRENPLRDIPPMVGYTFAPFIFSPEQTDRLIEAVCKGIRKKPKHYLKDLSVYIAISLMARCGLRIREPLRLQIHHYRSREKTLYIEKTKFSKDRLITVPKSVAADIDNYLSVRKALMAEDHNPYLLIRNEQDGLSQNGLRLLFHRAVQDIGIDSPRRVIGHMIFASPTPHSLRHSFAVNTLKRVKDRGDSPQHALPILATYMGHHLYQDTAKYLKFIDAEQRQGLFDFTISRKVDL